MRPTCDRGQIDDAMRNEHKFQGVSRIDADNAEMISASQGLRSDDGQRIIAFNLGMALEDVATATGILRRARERGIGVALAP
jgi:ornithine cyclodeaminase/alanine dehydrogenase-like protein (mu-crystallin family)